MKLNSLLFVLAATLLLIAGCAAPRAPPAAAGPSSSSPSTPAESAPGAAAAGAVSVTFTDVPDSVIIGKPIAAKWHIDGSGSAATQLVYSTKSHATDVSITAMTYQSSAPKTAATVLLPGDSLASFAFDEPIKLYLRAVATVDGKMYWSDEKVVSVVVSSKASTTTSTTTGTSGSTSSGAMY
jgi:hypothetical protein